MYAGAKYKITEVQKSLIQQNQRQIQKSFAKNQIMIQIVLRKFLF
jgi:hypothetical protein